MSKLSPSTERVQRKRAEDWRKKRVVYTGFGALLHFAECDGLIIAKNKRDLEKLCRGYYLATFNPKFAKRCTVRKR